MVPQWPPSPAQQSPGAHRAAPQQLSWAVRSVYTHSQPGLTLLCGYPPSLVRCLSAPNNNTNYSYRKATTGSSREAFHAGYNVAQKLTTIAVSTISATSTA